MIEFIVILFFVSILGGGVACISGFGITSLIAPWMVLKMGMGIAVAGISVAHFLGTGIRFLKWRKYINKQVFFSFGMTSAIGGLIGAVFHNIFQDNVLGIIFGCLLVFVGITGLTGLSEKIRFSGPAAWFAGALSGIFGGLVGNQGGIRSGAMFGFELDKRAFVATATGIALAVDVARMPVYFATQWKDMLNIWPLIITATIGVVIGTESGVLVLDKIPEKIFKRVVSGIILLIGVFFLIFIDEQIFK
jgi:uncharacterized membrane protein YfcA